MLASRFLIKNIFLGIPLSSKIKSGNFFHTIKFKDRVNSALLLQTRTFDSKRIKYKLARLSQGEFEKLKKKFNKFVTPTSVEEGERLVSNFTNHYSEKRKKSQEFLKNTKIYPQDMQKSNKHE